MLFHGDPVRPSLRATLAGRTKRFVTAQWIAKLASRTMPAEFAMRIAQRSYAAFDRQVAHQISRQLPAAIIGYENSALASFRIAREHGIPTILDAASVHHRLQEQGGIADADTPFRRAVNKRKNAEIAFADHILCCSSLAARSYIDAGVPAHRVHARPLGFEPGSFSPDSNAAMHTGPLRIAFAGRFTAVKGADLLAAALERLSAQGLALECRIAASRTDGEPMLVARLDRVARLLGKVPHEELAYLYRWADILVVPSRFDSFGLVVPEALACGLPVLASDHVGASDFITPGRNGQIIPFGDVAALTGCLAAFAADPNIVRAMRPAALASASGAEWSHYRAGVAATIASILGAFGRP